LKEQLEAIAFVHIIHKNESFALNNKYNHTCTLYIIVADLEIPMLFVFFKMIACLKKSQHHLNKKIELLDWKNKFVLEVSGFFFQADFFSSVRFYHGANDDQIHLNVVSLDDPIDDDDEK
jgi:hypothetical protein